MNPALVIALLQAATQLALKLEPTVASIVTTLSTSDKNAIDAELTKMRAAYATSFANTQSLLRGE